MVAIEPRLGCAPSRGLHARGGQSRDNLAADGTGRSNNEYRILQNHPKNESKKLPTAVFITPRFVRRGHDLNYVVTGLSRAATPHVYLSTVIDETPCDVACALVGHWLWPRRR